MAANNASRCSGQSYSMFGPVVDDCAHQFDFTLLFEESIMAILPSAVLLLLTPIRLVTLSRKKRIVGGNALRVAKVIAISLFGALQIALVALWATKAAQTTKTSIAAAVVYLLNSFAFVALSFSEHTRSSKPSVLLNMYLFLSILFDAVRARTLWLMSDESDVAIPFSVSIGLKILILALEEVNKMSYIDPSHGEYAPEETAGLFSRSLLWWINDLIWTGFKDVLSVDTLPPIDRRLKSDYLCHAFCDKWEQAPNKGNHALLLTMLKSLKWALLAPVIPNLCLVTFTIVQPLMINSFMDYLSTPNDGSEEQENTGYGLIGAYAVVYLGIAFSTAWAQQLNYRFVSMVRGCLVTAIYRKTTGLSVTKADDASALTLMSADVERITDGLSLIHLVWSMLLQIGVCLYLLYRVAHAAFIVPMGMFVVCGVVVTFASGLVGKGQAGWMAALERRVAVTSSMIGSMKGVKLSGLSRTLSKNISNLRVIELKAARAFRMALVYVVTLAYVPSAISPVITFAVLATIVARDDTVLDSTRLFTSLSLLALITQPLNSIFQSLPMMVASVACCTRVQNFLTAEPQRDTRERIMEKEDSIRSNSVNEKQAAVSITEGQFGWKHDEDPNLRDINVQIATNQLSMIIGPVGCGKSTLLKALLGETPLARGRVLVASNEIAFCDQTPWLTNGTVQDNITGFSKYDSAWYWSVVRACALNDDLAQLPDGDQTMIGSKGITLSGGQKQRVTIARAVYARCPICVFDDVLSGLDSDTQKRVFDNVFGVNGLLRSQGTTVIMATHAVQLLSYADNIVALGTDGTVVAQGTFEKLNGDGGYLHRFGLQGNKSGSSSNFNGTADDEDSPLTKAETALPKAMDDSTRRLGDRTVYMYYFQSMGIFNFVTFISILVIWTFLEKFPEIWLKWWGDANVKNPGAEDAKYISVYAALQAAFIVVLVIGAYQILLVVTVRSGKKLHATLLTAVLGAPMSYFAATDAGAIVNRFSQDIQLIDLELPLALLNTVACLLSCIAQAVMILPASYWLVFIYPFLIGALWGIQKYYLRTSRQLRFLDLEAKTPLYSQFLETLAGLSTIRAFGWQEELIQLSDRRLDASQKPFYLLFSVQRWLNLVLDLVTAALAVIVTGVAMALRGSLSAGFAGVALYNVMNLSSSMKSTITTWVGLETSIGAVARIKSFSDDTPSEALPAETELPPKDWPDKGALSFTDVSASYKEGLPLVLNKTALSVKPGQKVGICGRSGSGKSSLIQALFRMIELQQGTISIDGVDLSHIPRDIVREALNAIPQEPFFFKGTVQENADPRGDSSIDEIKTTLVQVQLWSIIEAKGGLQIEMTDDLLSHGQKQLFCLARAILHPGKIVVLDEATSNVDIETDEIIQKVIRAAFSDRTVVAIAHRLDSILDFDSIVVIDKGVIIEHDNPQRLLARPSAFKALYDTYNSKDGDDLKSSGLKP